MYCLIQARISSSRLPGKVLKKINGKELLHYLILSLSKSKHIKKIVVLTSASKSDKKICNFCKKNNIEYFKGSLKNTYLRFYNYLKSKNTKFFVRISGDSPLLDHRLLNKMLIFSQKKNFDIFCNIFPRSFPKGQSIEIINSHSFLSIYKNKLNLDEKEHVTKYFYNRPRNYKIINFKNKKDYSNYNFSVDTLKDFNKTRKILNYLSSKQKTINNLINAYDKIFLK